MKLLIFLLTTFLSFTSIASSYIDFSGSSFKYNSKDGSENKNLYKGTNYRFTYGHDTGLFKSTVLLQEFFVESSSLIRDNEADNNIYDKHNALGFFYKWRGRTFDVFSLKAGLGAYNFTGADVDEYRLVPLLGFGMSINHKNIKRLFWFFSSTGRFSGKSRGTSIGSAGYDIFLNASIGFAELNGARQVENILYGLRVYI